MEVIAAAIVVLALVGGWIAVRHRSVSRRGDALRALLDGADTLEAQLHDYRTRMQSLRALLAKLPSDMTAPAMVSIDPEAQVKSALRDLLAHRLWIQKESGNATQDALDRAVHALHKSSVQLAAQLRQLDEVAVELETAGQGLRSAYKEASAAGPRLHLPGEPDAGR